jgi:hypothetical protein
LDSVVDFTGWGIVGIALDLNYRIESRLSSGFKTELPLLMMASLQGWNSIETETWRPIQIGSLGDKSSSSVHEQSVLISVLFFVVPDEFHCLSLNSRNMEKSTLKKASATDSQHGWITPYRGSCVGIRSKVCPDGKSGARITVSL